MIKMITAALLLMALTVAAATTIFAHESEEEGDYRLVVGFLNEPAYEGEKNAVSIRVTKVIPEEVAEEKDEGHSHGDSMSVDVNESGAVFSSPGLTSGDNFEFDVPDTLAGLTIPFYSSLDQNMTGVIMVGESGHEAMDKGGEGEHEDEGGEGEHEDEGGEDDSNDRMMVNIRDSVFEPAEVSVKPGSTIVFMNNSAARPSVMSGMADAGMVMESGERHEEKTAPVEGLQDTLQVEVTYVPSGASRTMALHTVFGDPGHYVADLIPTSPGHYRFRFFGAIEGSPVDKTFDSMAGGGAFDDVQAASAIHFPEIVASAREVEGVVRGAQATAEQAREEAMSASGSVSAASTLGIIGIIVGAIGIMLGSGAVFDLHARQKLNWEPGGTGHEGRAGKNSGFTVGMASACGPSRNSDIGGLRLGTAGRRARPGGG